MRKLLYILPLFLMSCNATKWCAKHGVTSQKDTINVFDSTGVKIDTTWRTFYNPADSLKLSGQLQAFKDSLGQCKVKNTEGSTESNKIKIKYIIRNDSIFIEANTKPYEIKIAELTKTIDHYRRVYEGHTKTTFLSGKKREWLSYWQSWACLIFIGFIVFRFILKKLGFKISIILTPPFITITR